MYTVIDCVVTSLPRLLQVGHSLMPAVPAFSASANVPVEHRTLFSPSPSACQPHVLSAKVGSDGSFLLVLSEQEHPAS